MYYEKPLTGVKVVELGTFAAVPICARLLADWGADVIKIETPAGDAWRFSGGALLGVPATDEENPIFEIENFNKKFIALDLKTPEGMDIIDKLLQQADVFITNTRPQALAKLKLTYEDLKDKYPKLIWANVTGFGEKGPDVDRPGFDLVAYWARSGALRDLAEGDSAPVTAVAAFGDHPTGMALTAGVCAALVKQQMTGRGDKVTISLFGSAVWNLGAQVISTQYGDKWPKSRKRPASPLAGSYKCKDGEWLLLAILETERYWPILCKVIGREDLANDARYNNVKGIRQNVEACVDLLDEVFITKTQAEWQKLLQEADLAYETVRHFKDIVNDEQAWANEYLFERTYDNGVKKALPANPITMSSMGRPEAKRNGRIGENTEEVLLQMGYSKEQVEDYNRRNVIKSV